MGRTISQSQARRGLSTKRTKRLSRRQQQAWAILHDEVFMQPWFVPKTIYSAIRRLIPNIHLMKLRHYFDDYGCLRCGETETIYASSGFCHKCNIVVRSRIMASMKKRLKKANVRWEETASEHFFDQMNLAQLILHGISPTRHPKRNKNNTSCIK